MGFERGVVHTLELALEELGELRVHMRQLTDLSAQSIDQMQKFMTIASGMQRGIEDLKRSMRGEQHDPQS
jgi:hypothetical protein